MPDLGPRYDMKYLPGLFLPEEPIRNSGFKGQLLTPRDGCGVTKESAGRIVGGTPAKRGKIAQINNFLRSMNFFRIID